MLMELRWLPFMLWNLENIFLIKNSLNVLFYQNSHVYMSYKKDETLSNIEQSQEAVSIRKLTMANKVLPKRLPKQQTNNKNSIKILGWNCRSLTNRKI